MKKTFKLAKVLFKSSLPVKDTSGNKKQIGKIVLWVVMAIGVSPLIYFLYQAGALGYALFETHKESDTLIAAVIFIVSAGICFTGIAACINSLYFANNNNSLFVLPLKPTQIAGAKLIVATIYEYYLSFVILAPFLIGYGIAAEKTVVFWVGVVVAVILLPIVPMAYAGIIGIVFMQIFKSIRGRGNMTVISAIGVFLFTLLITVISRVTENMDVKSMGDVAVHLAGTLKKLTMIFVDVPFISTALVKQDFLSILIAIVASIAVLFLFWAIADFFYFSAAVGRSEKSSSRRDLDSNEMSKYTRKSSVLKSLTVKELRMISRDSACLMQCFLLSLGWPLLVIASALVSQKGGYEVKVIENLISLSENNSIQFVYVLFGIVFAVTLMATSLNAIAPTSISREGKGFMLIKQFPVPYKIQLKAKRNAALIVSAIGSSAYLLVGGILIVLMRGFPWWSVLLGLAMNFLLLIILIDIEMIVGLQKAKLDWESESDIMGKNVIGVTILLIGLVLIVAGSIIGMAKLSSLALSPVIFGAILMIALAALAFVFERILYAFGPKKMDALS